MTATLHSKIMETRARIEKYYFMIFAITFIVIKKREHFLFFKKKRLAGTKPASPRETPISAYFISDSEPPLRRC